MNVHAIWEFERLEIGKAHDRSTWAEVFDFLEPEEKIRQIVITSITEFEEQFVPHLDMIFGLTTQPY